MPELPEVETVVRDLRPLIVGRVIRAVQHGAKKLRKPWNPAWNTGLAGMRIDAIRRRGKWIVMELAGRTDGASRPFTSTDPGIASGQRLHALRSPRLVFHLGMTGQLTAVNAAEPRPDHLHLVFDLDDGRELRFRDPRRFGSATLYPDDAAAGAFFTASRLGPEPFGLDVEYFRSAIHNSARSLKALLLDQRVVAGVGNIYADEVCFLARLHPRRKGQTLTRAEVDRVRGAIGVVLTKAIEHRGSTIRDYIGGSGLRGGFQDSHAVYGRTGEPCPACSTTIVCMRLAGRATHYCPNCQGQGARGKGQAGRGKWERHNGRIRAGPHE